MTFGVLVAVAAAQPASDQVAPGVLGFLVVAAMGVALVFLVRSMNKQFRKITPAQEAPETPKAKDDGSQSQTARQEAPK